MDYTVKILNKAYLTHNVIRFTLEKPAGFQYTAGQAVEMTTGDERFNGQRSPFTMTSLNHHPHLEFIIKIYPPHNGMTLALSEKKTGDTLIITEPWDSFKNNGPGVFLAGGTGITPFIALLRQFKADGKLPGSMLIFSNKTKKDVFLQDELQAMLGQNYIDVITQEGTGGHIDRDFIQSNITNFSQPFYVCGPPGFVEQMQQHLIALGAAKEMVDLSL